ncbi:hypothetical protein SAMD00024442_25_18 [Candidatus Symbiothrix dinenymphae]|nr:hypothetical protein SAMD00024442_25_18 [Candidatus Symbiothrix dinenymphae]
MNRQRVFFLAPTYMNLYKDIVVELEKQQYDVFVTEDILIRFNADYRDIPFRNKVRGKIFPTRYKYWEKMIRQPEFNEKYDIFLCINGCSLDKILIEHLKKMNPNIKTILYLWDTNNYYNFSKYIDLFDKVFTFDRVDAIFLKIRHLPNFWVDRGADNRQVIEYQLSFIGSLHDDRYWLIKNILKQVEEMQISYYVKLFVPTVIPSFFSTIRRLWYRIFLRKKKIEEWNVTFGRYVPSFATNQLTEPQEFNRILEKSLCILDTDRASQSGLTPRLIWALAANKKIITTNKDIINYPFYSPDRILIIDREKPNIPYSFITESVDNTKPLSGIIDLRIDNWLKTMLNS